MNEIVDAGKAAVAEVRDVVLFLAPGFIALKAFQLLGAQRKRSEWEWTTWSVLVAAFLGAAVPGDAARRIVFGLAGALVLALVWRTLPKWGGRIGRWLRRDLSNSAWDLVLEGASADDRVIEIQTVGDDNVRFFGKLANFALEEYEAEPWIYLTDPSKKVGNADYAALERTWGVMLHRDQIRWLRVMALEV